VQERLFEVVVRFGRNVVVLKRHNPRTNHESCGGGAAQDERRSLSYLQILLAVEEDVLGFDFAVFAVDFVAGQHNRDVLTHTHQILSIAHPTPQRMVSHHSL
jgi:hypothetical protein